MQIPAFGERIQGQTYRVRPGAYGVIFDAERRIAVLRTKQGFYLPGGGSEPGETPEQTLRRETQEECGFSLDIGQSLGEAVEYVYAAEEATYFAKHGRFFTATLASEAASAGEEDHALLWLTPEQALAQLTHQSQVWAVRQALASDAESSHGR